MRGKPAVERQPVHMAPALTGSEAIESSRTEKDAELETMQQQVLVLEAQLAAAQRAITEPSATPANCLATPAGGCVGLAGPEQSFARRVPLACRGLSKVSSQPSLPWSQWHSDADTGTTVAQPQPQSCEGMSTSERSNSSVLVLTTQQATGCASVPAPRSSPPITQMSATGSCTHVLGFANEEATSRDQAAWRSAAGQWRPAQAFGVVSGAGPPQVAQTVRRVLGTRTTVPVAQTNSSVAPSGWHSEEHSEGRSESPARQAMPMLPAQPTPRTTLLRPSSLSPPASARNTVPSQVGQHTPSISSWSAVRGARQ